MPANPNLINGLLIMLALLICYLFVLIPILIYYAIQHMRSPQLILFPESDWEEFLIERCESEMRWAEANQFTVAGIYRWQQNFILACQSEQDAAYFQVTLSPYGRFHSFTTLFEGDYSLMTANDRESLIFPTPPRRYVQSFGLVEIDALHEKHQSAVADLIRVKHLELKEPAPVFEEAYLGGLHQQQEHVRSVLFYPIRGIWWYHIGRRARFNRPIDLQQAVLDQ